MTNKVYTRLLYIICTLFISFHCHAQAPSGNPVTDSFDFLPGERVVFLDNFEKDKQDSFPSRWEDSHYYRTTSVVKGKLQCCSIDAKNKVKQLTMHCEAGIIPKIGDLTALGDTFTVEYDFFAYSGSSVRLNFYQKATAKSMHNNYFTLSMTDSGFFEYNTWLNEEYNSEHAQYPGAFNMKKWHHCAMSYNKGSVKYYIDQRLMLDMPNCRCISPAVCNILFYNKKQVAYANIKIAAGAGNNSFNELLSDEKMVTHAINFDSRKATINAASNDYLSQLAKWLKDNPTIKLEIDGFTDNNGVATTNLTLSKQRADAVKKCLVKAGIDAKRLVTKGYGAAKPIDNNKTPEGKANNRRVEFVKLK